MKQRLFACAVLLAAAASCSAGDDVAAAEREVAAFERLADNEEYGAIYRAATRDLTDTASEREFTGLLVAIRDRMGRFREADRESWHVNYGDGGAVVTLEYDTRYDRGRGDQRFVYRIRDGRAQLAGYHFNSPDAPPAGDRTAGSAERENGESRAER